MSKINGCRPLLWTVLAGLLFLLLQVGEEVSCLRGSAVVLQAKAKAAELKDAAGVESAPLADGDGSGNGTALNSTINSSNSTQSIKLKSPLTGIPQKDYIYDPNLPRELNGHNLSDYPFYNAVPQEIDFNCDGLHDGFYASVPHKCQVYHHCLFGTRYDFLCANYTAFDQKTFICHFVSEVDCDNSPKHYKRNEALYKAATSAPPPATTAKPQSTSSAPPQTAPPQVPPRRLQGGGGVPWNRHPHPHRRPYRRRRPVYEYYYDEDYEDSDYYYDDEVVQAPRRKFNRKHRPQGGVVRDEETNLENQSQQSSSDMVKPSVRPNSPSAGSVYDKPRIPPKIRRPVPINERDKYDYTQKTSEVAPVPTIGTTKDNRNQQTRKPQTEEDDYYDDEYEDEQPKQKKLKQNDYEAGPSGTSDSRRPSNRHRLRLQNRKRTERYEEDDDDYDYELEERPRLRKGQRYDEYSPRSSRPRGNRGKGYVREDEAVPAERPGYISGGRIGGTTSSNRKRQHSTEHTRSSGRKHQEKRPLYEDDEEEDDYYDEEEVDTEEEKLPRKNNKSSSRYNGRRDDDYVEDSRNGRRQNTKISSLSIGSTSSKPASSDRQAERHKNTENDYGKPSYKPNDKSSDDKIEMNNRQTDSKTFDNQKISLNSNKNSQSYDKKPESEETYDNDEEYVADYEDTKVLSATKLSNGNERSDNARQSSFYKSRAGFSKDQINKTDETTGLSSGEDSGKGNNYYKSTTVSTTQEVSNTYSRNPSIYRSRTSSTATTEETLPSVTTSTTPLHRLSNTSTYEDDYQNRDYSQNYYKSDLRNRSSVSTVTSNNFKNIAPTILVPADKSEALKKDEKLLRDFKNKYSDEVSEKPERESISDSSEISGPSRPIISVGLFRRPLKSTTSNIIETTTSITDSTTSLQKNLAAIGFRRPMKPNESDEKLANKEPVASSGFGGTFRRPSKLSEPEKTLPPTAETSFEDDITQKNSQQFSRSGSSQTRKTAKTSESSSLENSYVIKSIEDEDKTAANQPLSAPGANYKKPFNTRPIVEDFRIQYDESSKAVQLPPSGPGTNYRRPFKGIKSQENQSLTEKSRLDYNVGSTNPTPSGLGGGFRRPLEVPVKNEGSTIINLRSHYGFLNSDRTKDNGNDNFPTAPDSTAYPRLSTKNLIDKPDSLTIPRQPPRNIDITAPGPSAPENSNQNTRNNFRPSDFTNIRNPPTGPNLDLADEEYDVTLNDALQPSTLHPTRSLADYPQARVKTRGFLSTVSQPSGFANNRGSSPFLLSTSSSQQYISRVQNIQPQETQSTNTESKDQSKDSQASADEEGYEAVVLAAPQFPSGNLHRWVSQRQSRPTEWYW